MLSAGAIKGPEEEEVVRGVDKELGAMRAEVEVGVTGVVTEEEVTTVVGVEIEVVRGVIDTSTASLLEVIVGEVIEEAEVEDSVRVVASTGEVTGPVLKGLVTTDIWPRGPGVEEARRELLRV